MSLRHLRTAAGVGEPVGAFSQAVVANGVNIDEIMQTVPESLGDLAPVLKLTVAGRMCSEIDGLVEIATGRRKLKAGDFVDVRIASAAEHDLRATLA